MQECVRETDTGEKDFHFPLSEQMLARGPDLPTHENLGNFHVKYHQSRLFGSGWVKGTLSWWSGLTMFRRLGLVRN
jgi:hypothetical protein